MTGQIAADVLSERILARVSYKEDLAFLEASVSGAFLTGSTSGSLRDEQVDRLLRYADILSHSTSEQYREAAYTLIALLREYQELVGLSERSANRVTAIASAVLVELGNFPGLRTLINNSQVEYPLPISRGILRAAKEVIQATKYGKQTLTDTQYRIIERMRGENYFSFAGPTSLGKSFILKDAIYDIAQRSDLDQHCVVFLVPTRALIGQTAADLRALLKNVLEVNVATFPSLPRFLQQEYSRTIFVFTPERLLRYLADPKRDIDYLIVDEAQKVISKKDARSSLYYHAIFEVTRRFETKLLFASPSVKNPELFLELFGKATNGALSIQERTVAQQRYFVDLVERKQYYLSASDAVQNELDAAPVAQEPADLVRSLSGNRKSIIYINSSAKSADFAMGLAAKLPETEDEAIDKLIKFVTEHIHKDYYLARTLKHGVAFHHGKMPQEVRQKIEALFSSPDSRLQYVVCTSTLLEGVNLPAKNIFVLNDTHGSAGFGKIDFENLVGRAGRLTYDFSGNVICVRHEIKMWSTSTRALIPRGDPVVAESFLVNPGRLKKPFTDIAKVLQDKQLPGAMTNDERRIAEQYSSILLLHLLDKRQTPLRTLFVEKVPDGSKILDKSASDFKGSVEVLRRSPGILPKYQNKVWERLTQGAEHALIPAGTKEFSYDLFEGILTRLGNLYNWKEEESGGREPLVPAEDPGYSRRLRYWAMLMSYWVRGEPLVLMIRRTISYHKKRGNITYRDFSRSPSIIDEVFDSSNPKHINIIIEKMMKDLETGLRFKIVSYLENYHDLSVEVLGVQRAGVNVAMLVEYGSTDPKVINLQEVGFSRAVALEILDKYAALLTFTSNDELYAIDADALTALPGLDNDIRAEVENILCKSPSIFLAP